MGNAIPAGSKLARPKDRPGPNRRTFAGKGKAFVETRRSAMSFFGAKAAAIEERA